MIQLSNISLVIGTKVLLQHANLTVHAGQKIGIVGRNGVGKSSFFALLLGHLMPEEGQLDCPKSLRFAHIRQAIPTGQLSAIDYALQGDDVLTQIHHELERAENDQDGMAIAHCHEQLAAIDGYAAQARAAKILLGLGFSQAQLSQSVDALSGGWRMRLNLAQVLLSRADCLLLDEPTNHLDLEGIVWLERWLRETSATVLVISHDRQFLDNTIARTVFLHDQKLQDYSGNYSFFEKTYAEQLALQQSQYEKQQKARVHMQKFVDRFRAKATKAKQAQSRLKMINRLAEVAPVRALRSFQFQFTVKKSAGNPMLRGENLVVGYDQDPVLNHVNFSLRDGDRIGLLGLNGAGKSTFIKLLAGKLVPLKGEVVSSNQLQVGYFAQHQLELLDAEASPMAHLMRIKSMPEGAARQYLGGYLFHDNQVFAPVKHFSGGEKARLVLALIALQEPNLLLLDEPTNHLDMEMREALSEALLDYPGAIVLVSHDRYLMETLADEFWLVHDHQVDRFDGDMQDYQQWLMQLDKSNVVSAQTPQKSSASVNKIKQEIKQLEKEHAKLEKKSQKVEQKLCDESLYTADRQADLQKLTQEQGALKKQLNLLEEQIYRLMESLE